MEVGASGLGIKEKESNKQRGGIRKMFGSLLPPLYLFI